LLPSALVRPASELATPLADDDRVAAAGEVAVLGVPNGVHVTWEALFFEEWLQVDGRAVGMRRVHDLPLHLTTRSIPYLHRMARHALQILAPEGRVRPAGVLAVGARVAARAARVGWRDRRVLIPSAALSVIALTILAVVHTLNQVEPSAAPAIQLGGEA